LHLYKHERKYMSNIEWEIRAKERRLENKELKKRIKELSFSRDVWKKKYMNQKIELIDVKKKVDVVKKKVQQIMNI